MNRWTKRVALLYGLWVVFLLSIASYGALFTFHGEYGISSHLWLTITGYPLSLLSWLTPHGTILGVLVAGVTGLIQWCAIVEVGARRCKRKNRVE